MKGNEIGTIVIESAMAVHREPGSGLLESVYEVAFGRNYPLRQYHGGMINPLRLRASAGEHRMGSNNRLQWILFRAESGVTGRGGTRLENPYPMPPHSKFMHTSEPADPRDKSA